MTIELRKNNSKLAELLEARNKLLEQKPELKELQFKINDLLAGAGTYENRVLLLKKLMQDNLIELHEKTIELQLEFKKLLDSIK
jgi:hypothetical protein